jgi:tetratricopeptide (TPR) repeat protein
LTLGAKPNAEEDIPSAKPQAAEYVPKITVFGLAKLLDQEPAQTQTGDILGTPGYMAPEQATGQTQQVGPATDVYALGAILYEALAGRPPFHGATVLDTLEQVRGQKPLPPSRLQPKVPRDLDTICLKCLEKLPNQRYPSAGALAEDLQRFRQGTPIRARPTPMWERLGKWARRRPAVAALVALCAVTVWALFLGLWLHTVSLRAEVERAEAGEAMARKAQARADTNYQQAREAINQMLARLDRFYARGVPQVESLRRELRKDALAFYQGIAEAEDDEDPARRFDVARAYVLMGSLQDVEAGTRSLEHARIMLEGVIAQKPANLDYQVELSRCLTHFGNQISMVGDRGQECLRLREQALAVCQALCHAQPDNATWQRNLAVCHTNLGGCYEFTRRWADMEEHWQEAQRILERLTRQHPEEYSYHFLLGVSYANLAEGYRETGRLTEGDDLYRKADALLTAQVGNHPENKNLGYALAQTLLNWAVLLNRAGHPDEALSHLTRAIQTLNDLLREDPLSPLYRHYLLVCVLNRAATANLLGNSPEADQDWRHSLELAAQLNAWEDLCAFIREVARWGAHAVAVARADWVAQQPKTPSAGFYHLVQAYALDAEAAGKDPALSSGQRHQKAERYAAAGMALLARLNQEGYFKDAGQRDKLAKDDDLKPFRQRAEFQELLAAGRGSGR